MGPGSRIGYLQLTYYPPPALKLGARWPISARNSKPLLPVPDTPDWKQKYRDSLQEAEAEEKRWRQVEQALRRLVGRLCAAGMGVNPQLDDELVALAAANRRNAPAEELEGLAASLTTVIVAVDAVSPIAPVAVAPASPAPARAQRWDEACSAVGVILQGLKESRPDEARPDQLLAELSQVASDAQLALIVSEIADLTRHWWESFSQERLKSAAVLSEVTERLGEMTLYLTESGASARVGFDDTVNLNDSVISQVREISAEVSGARELGALQSLVSARLDKVSRQMSEFRAREDARQQEQAGRTAHMHARIADLERESQELYRKLDREKHGARLDPLTRLANRKSFDERFAEEIARRMHDDMSVAMLLWDIDDFKAINDSYGHRAGDRVLQTVANSFVSGLRAEDFVARIGGEEFVVLLTGLGPEVAFKIANELRSSVESLRFHFRGIPVRVTVSCGITELRSGEAPGSAFDRADAALYRAKREGKNLCIAA